MSVTVCVSMAACCCCPAGNMYAYGASAGAGGGGADSDDPMQLQANGALGRGAAHASRAKAGGTHEGGRGGRPGQGRGSCAASEDPGQSEEGGEYDE